MSQAEIDAHNRAILTRDVANHLRDAYQGVELAQGALEDLEAHGAVGAASWAEQLEPLADSLRRAAIEAAEGFGS